MKNFTITDCLVKLSITIKLNDVYFLRCCCYCSSLKVIKSKTITERNRRERMIDGLYIIKLALRRIMLSLRVKSANYLRNLIG